MRSLSCDELSLGIKDKDTLKSTRRQFVGQNQGDGGRPGMARHAAGPGTTVRVNSLIKDGSMS